MMVDKNDQPEVDSRRYMTESVIMIVTGSRKSTMAIRVSLSSEQASIHRLKSSITLRSLKRKSAVRVSRSGDAYESFHDRISFESRVMTVTCSIPSN